LSNFDFNIVLLTLGLAKVVNLNLNKIFLCLKIFFIYFEINAWKNFRKMAFLSLNWGDLGVRCRIAAVKFECLTELPLIISI
jgi:hypothetical protein